MFGQKNKAYPYSFEASSGALYIFDSLFFLVVYVFSVLTFVQFRPSLPVTGLDNSWMYAIDYLSVHHFAFGSDIAFTFGPLALLYTRFHLPEHQLLYYIGSSFLILAFIVQCMWITRRPYRYLIAMLPLFFGNLTPPAAPLDSFFFVMPLLLILSVQSCTGRRIVLE